MVQDKYPDKIPKACRDDKVCGLADKNAPGCDTHTHVVIHICKNGVVPPPAKPPRNKADDEGDDQVEGNNVGKSIQQIPPYLQEHIRDDADRDKGRYQNCANLPIHGPATIT